MPCSADRSADGSRSLVDVESGSIAVGGLLPKAPWTVWGLSVLPWSELVVVAAVFREKSKQTQRLK